MLVNWMRGCLCVQSRQCSAVVEAASLKRRRETGLIWSRSAFTHTCIWDLQWWMHGWMELARLVNPMHELAPSTSVHVESGTITTNKTTELALHSFAGVHVMWVALNNWPGWARLHAYGSHHGQGPQLDHYMLHVWPAKCSHMLWWKNQGSKVNRGSHKEGALMKISFKLCL